MIKLAQIPTGPPDGVTKKSLKEETNDLTERIGELQETMYAESNHSLLVVFQGMDASGKDGATRNVFGECSPNGVNVYAFKKPTEEEFDHDFLWRVHKQAPRKGMIQIFNRSHYEDVLIQRVHGWIDEEHAIKRIESINAFETLLQYDNNTTVLKFYLHISKKEQEKQLRERIDEPEKHWKHNDGDWKERKHWDRYMECYEDAINRSTIPWHIIPVDERWYRDYVMAKIVVETMEDFNMVRPAIKTELFK